VSFGELAHEPRVVWTGTEYGVAYMEWMDTAAGYRNLPHMVRLDAAGSEGVYLTELPERLFDRYRRLGIIRWRPTRPERERWLAALRYEAANELTRYSRQRASLENLGLVSVEYEPLEELGRDPRFVTIAADFGLDTTAALYLARAILDVLRKNRALAYPFFQHYVDPSKRPYRELEAEPYSVRFPDRDRAPRAFASDRPDHIRKTGRVMGFFQENPSAGQLTAVQKIVARMVGGRGPAEQLLRRLVPLLEAEDFGFLVRVTDFPLPKADRPAGLRLVQIDPRILRLAPTQAGYRCHA